MKISKRSELISAVAYGKLNIDQKSIYDRMLISEKLSICVPTGFGKGFMMNCDLLNQIATTKNNIFVIASHRLTLNNQHTTDVFNTLCDFIGNIGFIFVGSNPYDVSKFADNKEYNTALLKRKLSYNDIISSTTSKKQVSKLVDGYLNKKMKVVIITTYHSLGKLNKINVDTLYCDESHMLATEEYATDFKDNFNKIKYNRSFFFTATPKDAIDDTIDAFLMNNKNVFGERVGITFKECVDKAYITRPLVHIAYPSGQVGNFDSIDNKVKFINECFLAHRNHIIDKSFDSSKTSAKMLVKCESVDVMWALHERLKCNSDGIIVCAGASRNDNSVDKHFIDDVGVDRNEFLEQIQKFSDTQEAIVLHYDIFSEGINVPGLNAVMFLTKKLPTLSKILQNVGRATRLHKADRDSIVSGVISSEDYSKWIKPFCSVIIPFWDAESEFTQKQLSKDIKSLRDNFGFDPTIVLSLGDDMAYGNKKSEMDQLNKIDKKDKKYEIIKKIEQDIESLDKEEFNSKEKERLSNLDILDWFKEANDL